MGSSFRSVRVCTLFISVLLLMSISVHAQPPMEIPQEAEGRIEQAMPSSPIAEPQSPRMILVFNLSLGYEHSAIPYAARMLEIMAENTGAFEVVNSSDISDLRRRSLRKFDAIVFNNNTNIEIEKRVIRNSLLNFVKNGGGIVGIHAATDNFFNWLEAARMMGGLFDNHPWTADGTWSVRVEDTDSPLTQMFDNNTFEVNDEIYRTRFLYDVDNGVQPNLAGREVLHVLLKLNMEDDSTRDADGVRPSDTDIPVSWIRNYGEGRIFYTSFGHNHQIYWTPILLQHYLAGIQFALGDLDANTTPSLDILLDQIADYEYGDSRVPLTTFDAFVRSLPDTSAVISRVEQRLLGALESGVTTAGTRYICEKLSVVGSETSVPILIDLLDNDQTADMALYALERIPGSRVDAALRQSLGNSSGENTIALINTLGQRRDAQSVEVFEEYINSTNTEIANAALAALGHIATREAAETLYNALEDADGDYRRSILFAYLDCAEAIASAGDAASAHEMYQSIYTLDTPVSVHVAAATGVIRTSPGGGFAEIVSMLGQSDAAVQSAAIRQMNHLEEIDDISGLNEVFRTLPVRQQIQLLNALGEVADPETQDMVTQATESENQDVRIAALHALQTVGDSTTVDLLAWRAAEDLGQESEAARQSLYRLKGEDVDETILQSIPSTDLFVKEELVYAVEEREIQDATNIVLEAALDPAQNVRFAAISVLAEIAPPEPQVIGALFELLESSLSDAERNALETTLTAVINKRPADQFLATPVIAELRETENQNVQVSLFRVLGQLGNSQGLTPLLEALRGDNAQIKRAAIQALSGWPNATPAPQLLEAAQQAEQEGNRVLALRGYIRLIGLESDRPPEETVRMYREAMAEVTGDAERRLILSGLANMDVLPALEMAGEYLDDPNLSQEAASAVVSIAESTIESNPEETENYLQQVVDAIENEQILQNAREILSSM